MPLVDRDSDESPRQQVERLIALEPQPGRARREQGSFVSLLILPEAPGHGVAWRDDSLDAKARRAEQRQSDDTLPDHQVFSSASFPTALNIAAADSLPNRFWTHRMYG